MSTATFRFHGDLRRFLYDRAAEQPLRYTCARAATLKNAIEALGVPHTEVGALEVNGEPATLQRIVREDDRVEVHPWKAAAAPADPAFVADAHLGGLARFLRMLGFDTLFDPNFQDAEIRRLAHEEQRVVLTRDRELLKCADVLRGAYVRALKPEAQLQEIAERYALERRAQPFTLCLHCNLPLEKVDKAAVAHRLPEKVLHLQTTFTHCRGCDRVYWPGTHYHRMCAALRRALGPGGPLSG